MNRWTRRLHRWGAVATFLPLLVVIASGILLQVKKEWSWIQPPTRRGSESVPVLSFDEILALASSVPEAEIASWDDVDRLDVRPGKGIVKVQAKNRWELQIDSATGDVLSSSLRRSDLIESLHDGSFFHDSAKLWVFLPNGIVLLGLWLSGVYLWWLPWDAKRRKRRRQLAKRVDIVA